MEKVIESIRANFKSVNTGRAISTMLDQIEVEYQGTIVKLKTIAQISVKKINSLIVDPYLIEKAIMNSSYLCFTLNNDRQVLFVEIPQLTFDIRKELSKLVAKYAQDGKVGIRNIRRMQLKAYDKHQKTKNISEDNVKDLSSDLQKMTDEYMMKIVIVQKQKDELLTLNPKFHFPMNSLK
ncbi:Ribosome-recycling factor, chloroplastic [Zostera marina]|uniref:Ribosome-recycling factor, chloroplastic n=1 Tax=Zostera marina TaxID=29655 RepID=A0A0K9NXC8_ZOSMR|nr:Ribosome-recycling factor, chloroplastic [Zostera marina]